MNKKEKLKIANELARTLGKSRPRPDLYECVEILQTTKEVFKEELEAVLSGGKE